MKYLLLSDVHGADLKKAYNLLRDSVDGVIIAGDLDRAYIGRQLNEILKEDGNSMFVPGNHDFAHIKKQMIYSGTLEKQKISSIDMWMEWTDDEEAYDLLNSIISNKFKNNYPTYRGSAGRKISFSLESGGNAILIHGGLSGNYQGEPSDLWYRLITQEDYISNFKIMEHTNHNLMIRGHDHFPRLAYINGKNELIVLGTNELLNKEIQITHDLVSITIGALFNGYYAILNDEEKKRTITFKLNKNLAFKR